ncbi:N-acetylmuramic acid 6-phosphate etherase [Paenibacillus illinoisensis]|uniref:N-acetylmuramic acid 6-phosphate etherase n=1 Tax=Paenibacillus illinoisensis TaxID=59845 RepID=UPI003D2D58B7
MDLSALVTEQRNPNSMLLDGMNVQDILQVINHEDRKVPDAVAQVLQEIERAILRIVAALQQGGRLFYVGAGTSGRLGALDAAECIPTYRTPPEMIQAIVAGGPKAMIRAVENVEDDEEQGALELKYRALTSADVVMGIAASGRTPFTIGALRYAREVGSFTIGLSCNRNAELSRFADCPIEVIVGPEVISGSTRMKAAAAQKMILTMISTTAMIKIGKTYENLMVDVHATNRKLVERAKRIVMESTGVDHDEAENVLVQTGFEVKPAIVILLAGVSAGQAKKALASCGGYVRSAIETAISNKNINNT